MTPDEMFDSKVAAAEYAINALSHPSDDTYRKNLARYLDSKGFDLVTKDNQLYIGDRNSLNTVPVTKGFMADMIATAPEIAGSIVGGIAGSTLGPTGATAGASIGSMAGDAIQQMINSYLLGEDLTSDERMAEAGKSAALGAAGELGGRLLGRAITPLSGIDETARNVNTALADKYGVELTPATATGHQGLSRFEEAMSKGSLGGKQIAKMKADEITGIENTARELLEDKLGGDGNVYDSGSTFAYQTAKRLDQAKDYFNAQYGQLVEDAGVTQIPVGTLRGTAKEILNLSEKVPAFKNGIDTFADNILESPEALGYEEYQQLRSLIGAKIKDTSVTGQTGSKEAYKRLYRAINEDFDNMFRGTGFASRKAELDTQFKDLFKSQFEDSFTRGVLGTSRNKIDPERIGGLVARSSNKANVARNTADSGFIENWSSGGIRPVYSPEPPVKASNAKRAAADYLLGRSVAPGGDMSLPKMRTNLRAAKGLDVLLDADTKSMKDDIVKLIDLSGQNNKVANTSGTAYMNELLRMKNDPLSALIGFGTDQSLARMYKNKAFQKYLTNTLLTDNMRKLINAASQTGIRQGN
jgi:hypothetical protein